MVTVTNVDISVVGGVMTVSFDTDDELTAISSNVADEDAYSETLTLPDYTATVGLPTSNYTATATPPLVKGIIAAGTYTFTVAAVVGALLGATVVSLTAEVVVSAVGTITSAAVAVTGQSLNFLVWGLDGASITGFETGGSASLSLVS